MPRIPRRSILMSADREPTSGRAVLACLWLAVVVIFAATTVSILPGAGHGWLYRLSLRWLNPGYYLCAAAIICVRGYTQRRPALLLIGLGATSYGCGSMVWAIWLSRMSDPPFPSLADALWLSFYPLCYLGIAGLVQGRDATRLPRWVWLDGLIAGSTLVMGGATIILPDILRSHVHGWLTMVVELAYPICDLLLVALVVGALALRSWRLNWMWTLLIIGFTALTVSDCVYAEQIASGGVDPSPVLRIVYMLGFAAIALAVWQRNAPPPRVELNSWAIFTVPGIALTCMFALLFYAAYDKHLRLELTTIELPLAVFLAAGLRFSAMFRDVRLLGRARTEAATDDLTGLANRRAFMRRVEAAFETGPDGAPALIIIDLDNFKQVNDTLGHPAGDALLAQMGPRLVRVVREQDMVARLGGDEFAVLLAPAPSPNEITEICERLLASLSEPVLLSGLTLRSTGSLGVAVSPDGGRDAHELMQHADVAMYQAKSERRGYAFYAPFDDDHSAARLSLTGELAAAINDGEIEVHFQPQVEAVSRRIVAAEALVRWRTGAGRLIQPSEWIPAAEQAGLARTLTEHVLAAALDWVAGERERSPGVRVSINTSVADLLDASFPAGVLAALEARELEPDCLTIEVTETTILVNPTRIEATLWELRRLGVGVALDDFGTGYSSLEHLRSLPVDEVKIDRSFVMRMESDPVDATIIDSIVSLASRLRLRVVAEGVETEETWQAVQDLGCNLVQGYAFSPPLPAQEFEALLISQQPDPRQGRLFQPGPDLIG